LYARASSIGPCDDDEAGVVLVEKLQLPELGREPGAARALPLLTGVPHVVVRDQLRLPGEHVDEPDRAIRPLQGVVGQLHHRQPPSLSGDGVELPGGGLLPLAQLVELAAPGRLVDDRGQWRGGHVLVFSCSMGAITGTDPA
jgi:hypothetical protein